MARKQDGRTTEESNGRIAALADAGTKVCGAGMMAGTVGTVAMLALFGDGEATMAVYAVTLACGAVLAASLAALGMLEE